MKLGTSLSRCVRDIYEGTVDINDVLVIVARTDFDPEDNTHWTNIWRGYSGGGQPFAAFSAPEWHSIPAEDEQTVRDICIDLKNFGKLHQPRQYGAHPQHMNDYWYDVILTPGNLENNPAAKKAWESYKTLAGLGK
jgi:hypothetical protein